MAMSGQSNKDYYVTMDCMVDFFFFIILTIKCDIFKSRHGGVKGAVWTGEPVHCCRAFNLPVMG